MKPILLTVHSIKGGTGKTTTAINLASLLAERGRTLLIDLHIENPHHQLLVGGPDPAYKWFSFFRASPRSGRFLENISTEQAFDSAFVNYTEDEFRETVLSALIPAHQTALFRDMPCNGNLFLLYSDYGVPLGESAYTILSKAQEKRIVQKRFFTIVREALSGEFDYVIVDTDAGGISHRENYPLEWQLHWYVNGYIRSSALHESRDMGCEGVGLPYNSILSSLERKKLFNKARSLVITNTSIAEIQGVKQQEQLSRVYGRNDDRCLILNGVTEKEVCEVRHVIQSVGYNMLLHLPMLQDVCFGKVGIPNPIPTIYGQQSEHRDYRASLERLVASICPHVKHL